jgi:outer membrane protein assembly factor BamA
MNKFYKYFIFLALVITAPAMGQEREAWPEFRIAIDMPPVQVDPPPPLYLVHTVAVTGNKKTRERIILREITFREGEYYSLPVLRDKIEFARQQLMNTALFHTVDISLEAAEDSVLTVVIDVKERWYLFPVPYFKPVDRNLNQWLFEKDASLDRVNYGIRIAYNNATGRNDKFRLWLTSGYTRQFSVSYDRLYIDHKMKWGLNTGFAVGKNREVNYNTIADKQVFVSDDRYLRSFVRGHAELSYRRAIRTRHVFGVAYMVEEVNDTIVALNPSYFRSGRNRIRVPSVYYNLNYFNLDYNPYPTRGQAIQLSVSKSGAHRLTNLWQLHIKATHVFPVSLKSFVTLSGYAGVKLPFRQSYYNKRFLGYSDIFLQGYEYNVIDGVAGGYFKSTLTRRLLDFRIKVPAKKDKTPFFVPLKFYGKIYGNAGYVHNPDPGENRLNNNVLCSGGIGIDIVTFYDIVFKLEWSFNHLGQNGLFLHRKTLF